MMITKAEMKHFSPLQRLAGYIMQREYDREGSIRIVQNAKYLREELAMDRIYNPIKSRDLLPVVRLVFGDQAIARNYSLRIPAHLGTKPFPYLPLRGEYSIGHLQSDHAVQYFEEYMEDRGWTAWPESDAELPAIAIETDQCTSCAILGERQIIQAPVYGRFRCNKCLRVCSYSQRWV